MSTNTIQMYVNIKKNNVSTSTGFGKYYLNADTNETLSNDGLVNHIMHHNCAVGREAIAAVIKKLGECIPGRVEPHPAEQAAGREVQSAGRPEGYPPALQAPERQPERPDFALIPEDAGIAGDQPRDRPRAGWCGR